MCACQRASLAHTAARAGLSAAQAAYPGHRHPGIHGPTRRRGHRRHQSGIRCHRPRLQLHRARTPAGHALEAGVRGRQVLESYFTQHLPAARAGRGDDLFAALCHASTPLGEQFSDADVVNHMIFLMMAAHDTSTITTAASMYHLAKRPDWQERARKESLALGAALPGIEGLEPHHARPDHQGVAAAGRARSIGLAQDGERHRDTRPLSSGGNHRRGGPRGEPLRGGGLDRSRPLSPRPVLAGSRRGPRAPIRLDPVRRGRAQVHRHARRDVPLIENDQRCSLKVTTLARVQGSSMWSPPGFGYGRRRRG